MAHLCDDATAIRCDAEGILQARIGEEWFDVSDHSIRKRIGAARTTDGQKMQEPAPIM